MYVHWINKFRCAFRGLGYGVAGQSSFCVHLPSAIAVMVLAYWLRCALWQWCVLGLCIGLVLSLELVNSALELLARGLCHEPNPLVGKALDVASSAVLVAATTSLIIGIAIFVNQLR
jgi:diacylglycerol kinase